MRACDTQRAEWLQLESFSLLGSVGLPPVLHNFFIRRIGQGDRKRTVVCVACVHLKRKSFTRERRVVLIFAVTWPVFEFRQAELPGNDFHQLSRPIKLRCVPITSAYRHYLPIEQLERKGANARKSILGRVIGKTELKIRVSVIRREFGAFQFLGAVEFFTL